MGSDQDIQEILEGSVFDPSSALPVSVIITTADAQEFVAITDGWIEPSTGNLLISYGPFFVVFEQWEGELTHPLLPPSGYHYRALVPHSA